MLRDIWNSVMERLLHRVTRDIPARVIMRLDAEGAEPEVYLSRFYLFGLPKMEDGSWPFKDGGAPKEGAKWPSPFGPISTVVLHQFHKGDAEEELHNHPWAWSFSIVLCGGYVEERRAGKWWTQTRTRGLVAPAFNFIDKDTFHKVRLPTEWEGLTWTLFVTGPKVSGWGFWNKDSGIFTPWREFFEQKVKERS